MQFLLVSPAKDDETGSLPLIQPDAYLGYFEAASRRLVFVHDPAAEKANPYFSCASWAQPFSIMGGHLPQEIVLDPQESAWVMACWKVAQVRYPAR